MREKERVTVRAAGSGQDLEQPQDSEPDGPGSTSAVLSAFPSLAAALASVLISARAPRRGQGREKG